MQFTKNNNIKLKRDKSDKKTKWFIESLNYIKKTVLSYWLNCRHKKKINSRVAHTIKLKLMLLSICAVCDCKQIKIFSKTSS